MPVSRLFIDAPSIFTTCYMHGYIQCTDVHAKETSRKRRYVVEYEDDSPNDVVRYHQYQNLDLLISQSTHQPLL